MFRYDMVSDVVKQIDAICQHNSDVSLEDQNCRIFYRDFTCIALSIYILKRPFWGETRLWPAVSLPLILSTYRVSQKKVSFKIHLWEGLREFYGDKDYIEGR